MKPCKKILNSTESPLTEKGDFWINTYPRNKNTKMLKKFRAESSLKFSSVIK